MRVRALAAARPVCGTLHEECDRWNQSKFIETEVCPSVGAAEVDEPETPAPTANPTARGW